MVQNSPICERRLLECWIYNRIRIGDVHSNISLLHFHDLIMSEPASILHDKSLL